MAGALSVDDQLLGEKMHYYCSSSEDEAEGDEPADKVGEELTNVVQEPTLTGSSRNVSLDHSQHRDRCMYAC